MPYDASDDALIRALEAADPHVLAQASVGGGGFVGV